MKSKIAVILLAVFLCLTTGCNNASHNCGALLYGYRNDEGKIKYECKRCGTVAVRVQKGRRHDKIDLYAPEGQIRYY